MENAFIVPLLPGKTDAAIAFANAMMNERRGDLDKAQITVTKEAWFLQQTPMGDFLIIYHVSPDGLAVHAALAVSEEPFDIWFREQVMDIAGIDITTPFPALPSQILSWSRE
jgi:hypothetical protein